ncbi:MAG: bifunctional [glutamine synthetase] adenylyltransferase/[glutamine synthetase]-adenylyl-L-tyrosine phosphorylase, partial [Bradyrhizobium sp.]|nr:bifunctional [glutamine synthetase] adenylyltransferase/[glutamine synthetase]-adenylyl-L-tyrosine phosphorylase [Bradyrhizobium sp.]
MTAWKDPLADAPSSTSLVTRLVEAPHVQAPEAAGARLRDWLAGVTPAEAAAIRGFLDDPLAGRLLLGIAEFSPYLFDLVAADAARLVRLLASDPDVHLETLMQAAARDVAAAHSEAELMGALRAMKSEAALLIALCDIGGVWPVMRVTEALTALAVGAVKMALGYLLAQEVERGRLLPSDWDHPEENSGLFVLAMGKMGAGELNYSSDIDLIVFFDAEVNSLAGGIEPQPFFARVTQALARLLQQRSGEGYVFRVDLRLRPDPASTQVAISTDAALHYYEREGR